MPYNHGVYNQEQETSLTTPIQGTAGLQVIFGTAPIHLAADPAAAVNKPVVCYSFAECQQAMGYSDDFENFTICQSMDACFRVFNVAPIILVNVLDPSKSSHTTQNAEEECAVADGAVAYAKQFVLLDTIVVKNADATLVAGSDYVATHAEDGTVTITILSEAAKEAETLKVASTSLKPDGVTAADIVGGVDALTGKETGLELIRQIYPTLGMVPGLILAPGWSHTPTVAAALQAKTENINGNFNCSCLLDISADNDGAVVYTSVKGAKEALGASSAHAAALWPMVAVGEKKYYFSAMFAALTAYTDANNADVPYESPSNKDLRITATVLKDGTAVALDQQQANDVLNANGVITAINANGFKSWGNNTAAYPGSTDPKDRWFCCRRFFSWWGNSFILTYIQYVDGPVSVQLVENIVDSENIRGNSYVAQNKCAGAHINFRAEENTATDIISGEVKFHQKLAPFVPAEDITNTLEFDPAMLYASINGGSN